MFWRKIKKRSAYVESLFGELQKKNTELRKENDDLCVKLQNLSSTHEAEKCDLRAKLREQTEADILLMIKRLEKKILSGESKDMFTEELTRLAALQSERTMYLQRGNPFSRFL